MVQILPSNTFTTAKWIVSATASDGTHTTIASALTSASSGDTIFIRPGTYTENLTLKEGVNLTAYPCDQGVFIATASTANVKIVGKLSASYTGSCWVSGICVQTNSDFAVSITGTNVTNLYFIDCNFDGLNNTVINYTSSQTSRFYFFNCNAELETTGIAFISNASGGNGDIRIFNGQWANDGASTTASTLATSQLILWNTNFINSITTSGTGGITGIFYSIVAGAIIAGGSGSHIIENSILKGGTASALSVSAAKVATCVNCVIDSSNTNAISGGGTLTYSGLSFTNTSSLINTTTLVDLAFGPNVMFPAGGAIRTSKTAGNTALLQAYDVDGTSYTTFGTLTANNTPTFDLATATTINGVALIPSKLVLISSQTASNSATLAFADTNFSTYLLICDSVVPVTNNALLQCQFTADSGSSYLATNYIGGVGDLTPSAATGLWTVANSTTEADLSGTIANGAPGYGAAIYFYGVNTGNYTTISGNYNSNGSKSGVIGSGNNGTTAINGFKVLMSSGNISSGVFTLYGIRKV